MWNFPIFEIQTLKSMTVVIDKTNSKKLGEILTNKLKTRTKKGNLAKHFGKLKRN